MILCMEPITEAGCGKGPVHMMHQFIGHSFKNFETFFDAMRIKVTGFSRVRPDLSLRVIEVNEEAASRKCETFIVYGWNIAEKGSWFAKECYDHECQLSQPQKLYQKLVTLR